MPAAEQPDSRGIGFTGRCFRTKGRAIERKAIRIADDEVSIRLQVRSTLEDEPRNVIHEATAAGKRSNACAQAPDARIVDLMMPWVSAKDVVEGLSNNPPARCPIIALTVTDNDEHRAVQADAMTDTVLRPDPWPRAYP